MINHIVLLKVFGMCGRYSFASSREKLLQQLGPLETGEQLLLNYNVAPTQRAYIITNKDPQLLQYFHWGLIPYWANDIKQGGRTINARVEGIVSKPSFRVPIRKKRCLVIADSFYEWRTEGKMKFPYRILPADGSLLVMAGIWDEWNKEVFPYFSFSIITVPANSFMSQVHDRMPAMLTNKDDYQMWLSDIPLDTVLALLQPAPESYLQMYRISNLVNAVKNNSLDLHTEIPGQTSLF